MNRLRPFGMTCLLVMVLTLGRAAPCSLIVSAGGASSHSWAAPVSVDVDLSRMGLAKAGEKQLHLIPAKRPAGQPVVSLATQFESESPGSLRGRLSWLQPPAMSGEQNYVLHAERFPPSHWMEARQEGFAGHFLLSEGHHRVLLYNYGTNEPGEMVQRVANDNLKYARARGDYIHPLYGLDGDELTRDWSADHPHHRGIYWAWPEVDYRGQRGDLHALQRVFARPNGKYRLVSGPIYSSITAENVWLWEDQEPIVHERALMRAWRAGPEGRFVDLEFVLTAMQEEVALARRGTDKYGGLNLRLAAARGQEIVMHTGPQGQTPRQAWAELSGWFSGIHPGALAVFQARTNPDYPGDWIQYPELNWVQPTFPAAGSRFVLRKGEPLTLRFRLWIRREKAGELELARAWTAYEFPPEARLRDL